MGLYPGVHRPQLLPSNADPEGMPSHYHYHSFIRFTYELTNSSAQDELAIMLHAQRERRVVKLTNELWRAMQGYVVDNFSSNHFSVGAFLAQHFKSGSPMADHVYPFLPLPFLPLSLLSGFPLASARLLLHSVPPLRGSCASMIHSARSTIRRNAVSNSSKLTSLRLWVVGR